MNLKETNPYQSPTSVEQEQSQRIFPLFLLWIAPWKIISVSRFNGNWSCAVFGFAGAIIQIGLPVAVLLSALAEPYPDLAWCIQEATSAIPFGLFLGGVLSCLFYVPALNSKSSWAKPLMLVPWMLLSPFAIWLVCFFCRTLDDPGFGIVQDDRPGWMTNDCVTVFGSPYVWLPFFVIALVWVRIRSGVES